MDKRRKPRADFCLLVQEVGSTTPYFNKSRDLSEEGIFVETPAPQRVGRKVMLRFALPEGAPMIFEGKVVRVTEKRRFFFRRRSAGMGIQFQNINDAYRKDLQAFVSSF